MTPCCRYYSDSGAEYSVPDVLPESLRWVAQISDAADAYRDPDLPILEHYCAEGSYLFLGEPIKAREHADQMLSLYSEEQHGHLVRIMNGDAKTVALIWGAWATWMLGYPEQAMKMTNAGYDNARRVGHPVDLGWALMVGSFVFDHLREHEGQLNRAAEVERLGRENSLPFLTECLAPYSSGIALIRKGQTAEGMALLEKGIVVWEEGGGRVCNPYCRSVLAEGMAQLGDLDGALHLIDAVIAEIERPDREERQYYAEALRIKGWLLSLKGDPGGAEHAYIASLAWARTQQAKSWELRTATSYARLMRGQGRVARGPRPARARLRLVHRRLRDEGPERGQGTAGCTRNHQRAGAAGARKLRGRRRRITTRSAPTKEMGSEKTSAPGGDTRGHWPGSVALVIALSCIPGAAAADKKYDPGVGDAEIKIGQSVPDSGPCSVFRRGRSSR